MYQQLKLMEKVSEELSKLLDSMQEVHLTLDRLNSLKEERDSFVSKLANIEKEIKTTKEILGLRQSIYEHQGVVMLQARDALKAYEAETQAEDLRL